MSKKLIVSASAVILAVTMAGGAIAHQKAHKGKRGHHGGGIMKIMKHADADKDGNISKDELNAAHQAKFKEFDLDANGTVTAEEVQKKLSERYARLAKKITRRFDKDRNGSVTEEEFMDSAASKLYRLDLNDDGIISKNEMPRRKRYGKRRGGKHWRHGRKGHRGHHGYHRRHSMHHGHHGRYHKKWSDHRGSHQGEAKKPEAENTKTPASETPATTE